MLGTSLLWNRSQLSGAEWTQPGLSKWQRDQLGSAAVPCVACCRSRCTYISKLRGDLPDPIERCDCV